QSGFLLAVFLCLNGLLQLLGGATHEWALYVLGRQRWVVMSRWATLGVVALAGALLVTRYFALGALVAVGVGRLVAQGFLLALARSWVRRAYPIAFSIKLLGALVVPLAVTVLWDPAAAVAAAVAAPRWLPAGSTVPIQQAFSLAAAGAIFALIFLVCLRVI